MGKYFEQFDLSGKNALITGGGSGIGKEIAGALAEAGATVMIAARGEQRLHQTAAEISAKTGANAHVRKVDLADENAPRQLIEYAQKTMGSLDILVGNAAVDPMGATTDFTNEDYEKIMAVNLRSNLYMTRAALPVMRERGWGRIIFITTILAQMGFRDLPVSVVATGKAGLEGFTRFAAAENGQFGITVNCIAPGLIRTQIVDDSFKAAGYNDEQIEGILKYQASLNPTNRLGRPSELSGISLLLASDAGSYINGARYVVDGGWEIFADTHPVSD